MSKPIVAVVGRPNVGKSTLFNKLCGQRLAIVEDTPGITRDRIFANCEWNGHEFLLVDTGGIEPKATEGILAHMREQAQIAIDTADCIIMVTDVRNGLTAADEDVAHMLRRSHKPIILAVNKCDKVGEAPMELYEFYNLGFDEVMPISSVHGHGTGDLLDAVCAHLDFSETVVEEDRIPVAIIGETNAGKSTLLNVLLNDDKAIVSDVHGTTRDVIEDTVCIEGLTFRFIDTAGIRDTNDKIEAMGIERSFMAMDKALIVIMMYDLQRPAGDFSQFYSQVAGRLSGKQVILAVNKCDITADIPPLLNEIVHDQDSAQFHTVTISAKHNTNIDTLKSLLVKLADVPDMSANDTIVTNLRHYEALTKSLEAITRVIEGLNTNLPADLLSQDLRECIYHLNEILGEFSSDEVLKNIFSHFCIGK